MGADVVWQPRAQLELADLAADPSNAAALTATTVSGQLLLSDGAGAIFTDFAEAPDLMLVDWAQASQLVGVGPEGQVLVSPSPRGPWRLTGTVPGRPQALDALPGRWHIATDHGIVTSTTGGAGSRRV